MTVGKRVRGSLAFRILLPLAAGLVLVLGLASVLLGRTVREEGLRELRERGTLLADTIAYNAELPLLARDTSTLLDLLRGAARDPDLLRADVYDAGGVSLISFQVGTASNSGARARAIAIESTIYTEGGAAGSPDTALFALDPDASAKRRAIGRAVLNISTDRTRARTRKLQAEIAAVGFGLLLLCTAIGSGVVRVISSPLRALVAATRQVAAGDLSVRVKPSSADEVAELGEAFNRMAADLDVARAEVLAERADLERRVEQRTEELERAQETLVHSEKLSAVGQLVAGVAHELNNPLTVVLGYATLLRGQISDPVAQRKLDLLVAEGERARKIVQNLLTFARKHKPERSRVDVNEVITRTFGLRTYQLRSEKISVETDLDPDLPFTWADFHQLQQVVLNLLVNAEQAIQDARKGSRIRFSTRSAGSILEIVIEDDGPGIPPEVRGKIFEPFFTTKDVGRGTGLGLSICYGIITEHGGTIRVESEPGAFTRFRITLPVPETLPVQTEEPETAGAKPVEPVSSEGPVRRVLVIDDDSSILYFVEDVFSGHPVKVETARGGRDGIGRLSTGSVYDMILTDMRMPEVDGRAVFRFVQDHRPELLHRLVFATGDVASSETLAFLEASRRPVLEKPFSVSTLLEMLETVTESALSPVSR